MNKNALLLVVALALNACTYGYKVAYDPQHRAVRSRDSVEVVDPHDVKRPYRVIGIVSADSYYMSSALKACRAKAGELGADAITEFAPNGNQTGGGAGMLAGASMSGIYGSYNTGWSAKAIVWQ